MEEKKKAAPTKLVNKFAHLGYYSETDLQIKMYYSFLAKHKQHVGRLFHVANGGLRSKQQALLFQKMGVVAGVADFILITPKKTAFAIEVKTAIGTQSEAQKVWGNLLGDNYFIVRSVAEFDSLINKLIVL